MGHFMDDQEIEGHAKTRSTGRTVQNGERAALEALVEAWESLSVGNYSPARIQRWLNEDMKPAIDAARTVLGRSNDR